MHAMCVYMCKYIYKFNQNYNTDIKINECLL